MFRLGKPCERELLYNSCFALKMMNIRKTLNKNLRNSVKVIKRSQRQLETCIANTPYVDIFINK